jgi:hypothetical protein
MSARSRFDIGGKRFRSVEFDGRAGQLSEIVVEAVGGLSSGGAGPRASPDVPRPQAFDRMGQQLLRGFQKSNRVRQLRV